MPCVPSLEPPSLMITCVSIPGASRALKVASRLVAAFKVGIMMLNIAKLYAPVAFGERQMYVLVMFSIRVRQAINGRDTKSGS